jgi:hypothetical protein
MTDSVTFQRGDRVVHPRKPEWGDGEVRAVQRITHQGQPAQRVTVQFANEGRKVINTAVAPLQAKDQATPAAATSASTSSGSKDSDMTTTHSSGSTGGWIESLERSVKSNQNELWDLPEAMTDPFSSFARQLEATLESYRFSTEPRALIEWAVMQTGLNDPLSRYSRPELEEAFPGFARNRDKHLKDLVRRIKQAGETDVLHQARNKTRIAEAKKALDKAMQG